MTTFVIVIFTCLFVFISADRFALNNLIFSGNYDFIDLTYSFDEKTIYWLRAKNFEFTNKIQEYQRDGSWYAANDFSAGEHGGTHLDAPQHFNRSGKYVADINLEKLIVPLIIVDISSKVNGDPNFVLYKHHLDYLLNDNNGRPCLIIFKFGWSKFSRDQNKYLGLSDSGELNFPGLSTEVAEWIVSSYKNVVGIGVDVASVDPGSSKNFPVHKINAKAGIYNIENVKLDVDIPEFGCTALVLPMKIRLGTGAPLRLVAICPKIDFTYF